MTPPRTPSVEVETGGGPAQWAVKRPDGVIFTRTTEDEARAYVAAGNTDGRGNYRLLRRWVLPWEDLTDGEPEEHCDHRNGVRADVGLCVDCLRSVDE